MVSLNMTRCSFILTTALLFCVLVVVTGRSVENEKDLTQEIDLDTKFNVDDDTDDGEAHHLSSARKFGLPSSTVDEMSEYIQQLLDMLRDQSDEQQSIIIVPISGGGGGGGDSVDFDSEDDSEIPIQDIAGAVIPEIIASNIDLDDTIRRRRRRRRRPVNGGNRNRRVKRKRRRNPNGSRLVVLRSPATQ